MSIAALVAIAAFVVQGALPFLLAEGGSAVVGSRWAPQAGSFGMAPLLVGSAVVSGLSVVLALPLGLLLAIFVHTRAETRGGRCARTFLVILAAVPSVVYGLWGLTAIAPLVRRLAPPGPSVLAASLCLAVMTMPTIAIMVDAAFRRLPRATVAGAAALALSPETAIWKVYVPAIRGAVAAAGIVGLARALGETMVVLMVAGNVVQFPTGPFASIRTLTANIGLEMAYAMDRHRSALFACGLLLLVAAMATAGAFARVERRVVRR
ncbi:MAG: ABC transporter permease subunit [Deltaproteobacteria bacterium]|nr:ABC transporter permease subunit [Deltaproteobacteria bacterium]